MDRRRIKPLLDGLVLDMDLSLMLPSVNRGRVGNQSLVDVHGTVFGRPAGAFVAVTDDVALIEEALITQFPFTVAGWFNTGSAGLKTLLWIGDKDVGASYIAVQIDSGGDVNVLIRNNDSLLEMHAASLADGAKHHSTGVFYVEASAVKCDIYIDGAFAETLTNAGWSTTFWSDITADRTAIGRAADLTPNNSFKWTSLTLRPLI